MIYIIGLAHRAQTRRRGVELNDSQSTFSSCLRGTVETTRPAFIAEEFSEEALEEISEDSIAREIAFESGILHRFCDPNSDERHAIGYRDYVSIFMGLNEELPEEEKRRKARAIEICRYFPLREEFWLERLREFRGRDGIFICGDGHIEGFTHRLDNNQIPFAIVERGIGLTSEDDRFYDAVRYLTEHPEIANGDTDRSTS
jgi:hypothetical protein